MIDIRSVKDIGRQIRDARKQQALTQEDLAGMTGIGRGFISDLEGGKETAHMGKALIVCAALGLGMNLQSKWRK